MSASLPCGRYRTMPNDATKPLSRETTGQDGHESHDEGRPTLAPGTVLGRYVLLEPLGRGGGGVVYAAFDSKLGRRIALKLLAPRTTHDLRPQGSGRPAWDRLAREAQIVASLDHPNVVTVFDVGIADGHAFIAMELVCGRDLADHLAEQRHLGWRQRLRPVLHAARGLAAAHQAGVVHGDFKPANVLVGDDGRVRVSDFGIARLNDRDQADDPTPDESSDDEITLTHARPGEDPTRDGSTAGALWGTPLYAAPELHEGAVPDEASDLYALSVSIYEAIYGELPFDGESLAAVYAKKLMHRGLPRRPRIPRALRELVAAGLSPVPSKRPGSAAAIATGLELVLAPRRSWMAPVAGTLALGVAGGLALGLGAADEPCKDAALHLESVWDDERRDELHDALLDTGLEIAAPTWTTVSEHLDAYATEWVDTHRTTCQATARGEQSETLLDRKMTCLDDRRAELRGLVDRLVDADAASVPRMVDAVTGLRSIAQCADDERMLSDATAPYDPALADRVAELRTRITEGWTAMMVGDYQEGLEVLRPVLAEAETLGFAPLEAEARYLMGRALNGVGEPAVAVEEIERAALLAEENDDDHTASQAGLFLLLTLVTDMEAGEQAMGWLPHVEVSLRRAGADTTSWAQYHRVRSIILRDRGRHEEAQAALEAGIEIAKRGDPDNSSVLGARLVEAQGELASTRGDHRHAIELLEEARTRFEAIYGAAHPKLFAVRSNIADELDYAEDYAGAATVYEPLRADAIRTLGPDHPVTLAVTVNYSNSLAKMSKFGPAIELLEEAESIAARTLGREHPRYAGVLGNLSATLGRAGRYEESKRWGIEALTLLEAKYGPDHRWVAFSLNSLATSELYLRDYEAAINHLERSERILEKFGDDGPQDKAERDWAMARALDGAKRDPERAILLAEEALAIMRRLGKDIDGVDAWIAERRDRLSRAK